MMVAESSLQTRRAKLLIGSEWLQGESSFEVFDKTTQALIGHAEAASRKQVDAAVDAAHTAFERNTLEPWDRYRILCRVAELIDKHRAEFCALIAAEAGFPLSDGDNEVNRAVQTFLTSA